MNFLVTTQDVVISKIQKYLYVADIELIINDVSVETLFKLGNLDNLDNNNPKLNIRKPFTAFIIKIQ